ncbi:hypothetical protein BATDEDRAFT_36006 [Batrachochytrium dendrobatidis JAM81]|uniref:Uncharacterized protein n=1 Tax=Batrachochytrium dendrobatidis (strain JAM81 / FGSC 10211) TaxID=684364 RepID=F4PBD1_BATDJ|nr:uncharacterized protein BATDEDRAFT_36006 [Batrachochytrium dendrobatidis JAM81]EGF77302.1 hypothetical protein BATDEDRAFT_36006 [Batrachochytrium dendrobatidis JAM81]|eukprot:XP_006681985.1 hypothetical protein BATDEDRAFT_36006 [Batrachochytrium dendrobatidis JAM81]
MDQLCAVLKLAIASDATSSSQIRLFREADYFFTALGTERSVRTVALVFIQLACSTATLSQKDQIDARMQQIWLQVINDCFHSDNDQLASRSRVTSAPKFAGLLISLLESSQLREQLVLNNIEAILTRLLSDLNETHQLIREAANANYNPDKAIITATHYLLQSYIAIVSKSASFLQSIDSAILKKSLDISILFVNEPFLTYENRILAGLSTATLVAYWVPDQLSDWLVRTTTAIVDSCQDFSKSEDATLILLNGFLHVIQPQLFGTLMLDSKTQIIHRLYNRVFESIQSTNEPQLHILAFGIYTRIFGVLKGLIKTEFWKSQEQRDASQFLIKMCFDLILDRWEDPLMIIQHKLQDLFIAVLSFVCPGKKLVPELEYELNTMIKKLISLDWHKKAKYDLLSIIMHEAPARNHVILSKGVLERGLSLLSNHILGTSVTHFVYQALVAELKNNSTSWPDLIVQAILTGDTNVRKLLSERIIPKLSKFKPSSLSLILQALEQPAYASNQYVLYAQVTLWKSICNSGSLIIPEAKIKIKEILNHAITHPDIDLRFDALELLTSGRRTSEDIEQSTYEIVKMFLQVNMCVQSSDSRQRLLAQLQRFFERIKNVMYANLRQIANNNRILSSEEAEVANNEINTSVSAKEEFLLWLQRFLMASMFPGASFQRVNLSLSVLKLMRQVASSPFDSSATFAIAEKVSSKFTPCISVSNAQTLFAKLAYDTYETARLDIIEYLVTSDSLPILNTVEFANQTFDQALSMLRSLRAADVERGVFLVLFLFRNNVQSQRQTLIIDPKHYSDEFSANDMVSNIDPTLSILHSLSNILNHHLSIATNSLLVSSEKYPLNGFLSCIGNILKSCNLSQQFGNEWKAQLESIINMCFQACRCTVGVCSDLSPEGNIPENFAQAQDENDGITVEFVEMTRKTKTDAAAQIILRHCFRTIKEATFVLESLVCNTILPQTTNDSTTLLSYKHVQEIGELLCSLLSQIRHRGAFSAVHSSFTSIAHQLLMGSSQDLAALPRNWLEGFMAQVTSVQVSVTRRSAGLPYAVLALLSPAGPSQDYFLNYTIPKLCEIVNQPIGLDRSQQIDHTQVHAFNILRTVFHDSELSHKVRRYLGTCFILCIQQFSSPLFPIRNCAAMLFASLLGKCFGVQAKQFEVAVAELEKGTVYPLLYPILTVLARLKYTSKSAEKGSLFSLMPFVKLVRRCANARLWAVREMAARVTESLLPKQEVLAIVSEDVKLLRTCSANQVHGILLQARSHLATYSTSEVTTADLEKMIPAIFEIIKNMNVEWLIDTRQFISASVVMEIASTFTFACDRAQINWRNNVDVQATAQNLVEASSQILSAKLLLQQSFYGSAALVFVGMIQNPPLKLSISRLSSLVNSSITEIQRSTLTALKHIILHCDFTLGIDHEDMLICLLGSDIADHEALLITADIVVYLFHAKKWQSFTSLLKLHSHFAASFHKPSLAYVIQAWLSLMGINLKHAVATKNSNVDRIASLFIESVETITETNRPIQISRALLESFELLEWLDLLATVDSAISVRFLFVLDQYLGGEANDLRSMAAKCMANIANDGNAVASLPARWLCRLEMVRQANSVKTWHQVLEFFKTPLMSSIDTASALSYKTCSLDVLFDKEHPNSLFEELGDVILSGESLVAAFQSNRIPATLANEIRSALSEFVERGVTALTASSNLLWLTADPVVFSAVARTIACAHVLESTHVSLNTPLFSSELCSKLHPLLSNLAGHHQRDNLANTNSQGWQIFRSIILGPDIKK